MNRLSLRTKGLLFVMLISLIPLVLAGYASYKLVKDSMLGSAMEQAGSDQSANAETLSRWIAIRRAEVQVLSHTGDVVGGTDEQRLAYFEAENAYLGNVFHTMGYIDGDGDMLLADGHTVNLMDETYVKTALQGNAVITDPLVPDFDDQMQTIIVVPVYGKDSYKPQGAVYASILMSRLEPFYRLSINHATETRVYNGAGEIVYKPDPEEDEPADSETGWTGFEESSYNRLSSSGAHQLEANNKRYIFFYTKIKNTPWYLVSEVPLSKLVTKLEPIYLGIFGCIALAELIILSFCFVFVNRIVRRLERILAVTEQAAAGRFGTEHLSELPDDEIGKLARSVNGMTEHLSEMFDRLEAIINQNQYAFIILNEQFRIEGLNPMAEELLGYKLEELKDHATPLTYIDEQEIKAMAERLSAELGREIQPGLQVFKELQNYKTEREWTFIAKDGTRTPVILSSNTLRDGKGRITGYVGIAYNVSEKKQVELMRNRLLDIVESAKDLIASVDKYGRLIYINKAGVSMLGLQSRSGFSIKPFFAREMFSSLVAGAKAAIRDGYWESEAELLVAAGKTIPVSIVVVAHSDNTTGELFYSCIARDIYEQRSVQEELIRAKLDAEEANQAKSKFLALMSHEIRTPLNGIIGLTQLVRKTGLSETQKEYIDKIGTSSDTLLRLINDILDFSKIEAGKTDIERFAFQPEELLNQLAGQLSVFMGGKEDFEFIIQTPPNLPKAIIGDPLRLEQILLNLSMNAIKFTNRGRVKLELVVMQQSQESVMIRFVIEDTGIGMSKEQLSKLFKPFTQADSSTTRKYGGTGLGLFIATHFLEMMGSKLRAESEEGSGSKFYFTLQFPIASGSSKPVKYMLGQGFLTDKPVWIVENDPLMSELLCSWMESFGLIAVPFRSWKAARERLRRVGPGALPGFILLDMEMEDMYGMETWLEFERKARDEGVPAAVMTTTYGKDELLKLPEADRPFMLLTKPITRLSLFHALSALLEKAEHPKEHSEAAEQIAASEERNHPHIRILLAEDNKINQLVSIESLKGYGFVVGLAENGREVLEKLEAEEWHLVLMDIHMPEMDGEEAVRIIRSNPKFSKLPVIALTANGLKADHDRYIQLGMNDVVTKPVDARVLYETLAYWLGNASEGPQNAAETRTTDRSALQPLAARQQEPVQMPQIKGIDMNTLLARVGGKQGIVHHMLQRFKHDYAAFCDELARDLEQGDFASAKRRAHTLKGVASNLSAGRVMSLATTLDNLLQRPRIKREEWVLPVEILRKELAALIQAIDENLEP